jgi:ribonuclease J
MDLVDDLKLIPLGGQEEVGLNMMIVQYGDDIIIVDLGLEFPGEELYGIDYIIPNVSYLQENRHKIRGVLITHGNLDHIGGTPYIIEDLGLPTIYTRQLTKRLIERQLEDFNLLVKTKIEVVTPQVSKLRLGCFEVEFFHVNHNIPDSMGIALQTPVGLMVHTGDFKFDLTPLHEPPADFAALAALGDRGVLIACSDSTNALEPGHTVSEAKIAEKLDQLIGRAQGRVIISTFSSLINRIQQVIDVAQRYGRKIVVNGRSMITNVEIARDLGYIRGPTNLFITLAEADRLPDNQVLILSTGAQATRYSALARMSRREHRDIAIRDGDTVILSSSIVPGNERAVQKLIDGLVRQGAQAYYQEFMDLHTTGHAQQEDLKLMLSLIRPKFFMPVEGYQHMLVAHAQLAREVGIPASNIIVARNGDVVAINQERAQIAGHVPVQHVLVDGLGIGDVGKVVLRDREQLASDGIVIIVVVVDDQTGELIAEPEVISRGFVYLREAQGLIEGIREQVKRACKLHLGSVSGLEDLKVKLTRSVRYYLYQETKRRPMVLVSIVGI